MTDVPALKSAGVAVGNSNGVVYRTDKKPVDRDLWRADKRARCPECTAFSTTMAYSGLNTCETINCPVDVFGVGPAARAPDINRPGGFAALVEWADAVQVGPRLKRGEVIEQVRKRPRSPCCGFPAPDHYPDCKNLEEAK